MRSVRADSGEEQHRAIERSNRRDGVALERVDVEMGHDLVLPIWVRRAIRWMPDVMQEACQFHSLAVNRGFLGSDILFQRDFCGDMVKIADYGKFTISVPGLLDKLRTGLIRGPACPRR